MEVASFAKLLPGLNQALMDRVELVRMQGNDAPLDSLLQPSPLKHCRLENRGRRIGVIFQQFRRTVSVKAEIEPTIEAGLIAVPAFGDQRPEGVRYLQPAQVAFVVNRVGDEFEAHRVAFAGRCFDLAFDLIQRERIIGAFVPVALVIARMYIKSGFIAGVIADYALRSVGVLLTQTPRN